MMKKLLFLFTAVLAIAGCKKSDDENLLFGEKPEARMKASIEEVSGLLASSPNGWVATLPTSGGGGYGFYMAFDRANEKVVMYSDINSTSAGTAQTSTYRVKSNIGAELIFDTYNYISMLSDANPSTLGGVQGKGFSSDSEFLFDHSNGDSAVFIGKKYRQLLKMVKATPAQKDIYTNGGYKAAIDKVNAYFTTNRFPYVEISSGNAIIKADVIVNNTNNLSSGKRISINGVLADGKTVVKGTGKFAFTLSGADILEGGLVLEGIHFIRMAWKDANTLALYDTANKEYIIKNGANPATPLFILIGNGLNVVSVPNATTYTGWSNDYVTRRATANNSLRTGGYNLRLFGMYFTFNDVTKRLALRIEMPQFNAAGTSYTMFYGTFNYTYTRSNDGVFKFTYSSAAENGSIIRDGMAPLLQQRLEADQFTVEYLQDTNGTLLAQFKSIEHPDFTFTGTI